MHKRGTWLAGAGGLSPHRLLVPVHVALRVQAVKFARHCCTNTARACSHVLQGSGAGIRRPHAAKLQDVQSMIHHIRCLEAIARTGAGRTIACLLLIADADSWAAHLRNAQYVVQRQVHPHTRIQKASGRDVLECLQVDMHIIDIAHPSETRSPGCLAQWGWCRTGHWSRCRSHSECTPSRLPGIAAHGSKITMSIR